MKRDFIRRFKINNSIMLLSFVFMMAGCKKTPDTPLAIVPERLAITAASSSIAVGATVQFNVKYFNNTGQEAQVPAGTTITWSSANSAIATIDQMGLATGKGAGQTEIEATYNAVSAKSLLTVVIDDTQLATVMLMPADIQELKLNETATITAAGKNNSGTVIPGLSFSWQSTNTALAEVNANGVVTGKAYGTTDVKATSMGIQSAPVMVQVIRKGNFAGSSSGGMGKLKIDNGNLKLQTTPDFVVQSSPPDLRIYLGNNNNNINGAVEIASLSQKTGAQSWNVPAAVTITQYRYVIVWCKRFGGTYGVADLGN